MEATVSMIVEAMIRMYKLEKEKIAITPKIIKNQLITITTEPMIIICVYHRQ
jgi:hypothetical protein